MRSLYTLGELLQYVALAVSWGRWEILGCRGRWECGMWSRCVLAPCHSQDSQFKTMLLHHRWVGHPLINQISGWQQKMIMIMIMHENQTTTNEHNIMTESESNYERTIASRLLSIIVFLVISLDVWNKHGGINDITIVVNNYGAANITPQPLKMIRAPATPTIQTLTVFHLPQHHHHHHHH